MSRQRANLAKWLALVLTLGVSQLLPLGRQAQADPETPRPEHGQRTLAEQLVHDLREGSLAIEGDHAAVSELILKRNIPIPYKYIESLMWAPNAFGAGPACVICHSSNDATKSYRGLDLSTCEGILRGSQEEPRRTLFTPGTDPKRDVLVRRLRNNRMPLGVHFNVPKDSPSHLAVRDWISAGAKNDAHFQSVILPLFIPGRCIRPGPARLYSVPHVQSGTSQLPRIGPDDLPHLCQIRSLKLPKSPIFRPAATVDAWEIKGFEVRCFL